MMSGAIVLAILLVIVILLGAGIYWYKRHPTTSLSTDQKTPTYLGFKYNAASPNTARIVTKTQSLVNAVQGALCVHVKPIWASMKAIALAATPVAAGASCSTQKAALIAQIQQLDTLTTGVDFTLSSADLTNIKAAITDLLSEVLDQTCDGDKLNVTRAVSTVDDLLAAFCN